jgi:tetratricopeptide (TPR) repeat protein
MKRLACHFLLCCGIAGLASACVAGESNTNSNAAASPGTTETAVSPAPLANTNADPVAKADTNSSPAALADTNSSAVTANTNSSPAPLANTNSSPVALADINSSPHPPANTNSEPAALSNTNSSPVVGTVEPAPKTDFEIALEMGQQQRHENCLAAAARTLEDLLKTNSPPAIQRAALFELALVMQDDGQSARAQQIWSQYIHLYPDDPAVPDVLLRQGILYRKMGAEDFSISKFYAVMSSALKLRPDNMASYKRVVAQAQTEIADTYYLEAKFDQAADFYNRIIKSGDGEENREQLQCKRIRALSYLTNHTETIAMAQDFLTRFPKSSDVPEVRFLLASAFENMERNADALEQVLLLLQSQQENVSKEPEAWAYWQRRAGNKIANQLYKQGDYADALQIYLSLVSLDASADWQGPVLYQAGMAYEQLQQWKKADEIYSRILDRQKELTATNTTPALASLMEMARWRKDYIAWIQKAKLSELALHPLQSTNTPGTGPH